MTKIPLILFNGAAVKTTGAGLLPSSLVALKKPQHLLDSRTHIGLGVSQKFLSFRPRFSLEGNHGALRKVVVVVAIDIVSELSEKMKRVLRSRGRNAKNSYGGKHCLELQKAGSKVSELNLPALIAAKVTWIVAIDDSIKRPGECACCVPEPRKHQQRCIPSLCAFRQPPVALRCTKQTDANYYCADRSDRAQPISQVCLLHGARLCSRLMQSTYTPIVENARG